MSSDEMHELKQKVDELEHQVTSLSTSVQQLTTSIEDLLSAWKAAGVMVSLAKWAAGMASGVLGAWLAFMKIREGHG